MRKKLINPPGSERVYKTMRYSQAVEARGLIWVSGQVGMRDGVILTGIKEQSEAAFENLQRVLETAGSGLSNIVELTTFHINLNDIRSFARVKNRFITENYPAWSAVGVTQLMYPELLIEIKAVALAADPDSGD